MTNQISGYTTDRGLLFPVPLIPGPCRSRSGGRVLGMGTGMGHAGVGQVKDSLILITLLVELGVAAAVSSVAGAVEHVQGPAADASGGAGGRRCRWWR